MQGQSTATSSDGNYAAAQSLELESESESDAGFTDIPALQELRHTIANENRSCCATGELGDLDELAASSTGSSNFFTSALGVDPFIPQSQRLPVSSEEEWQTRLRKRNRAIKQVKRTPEYRRYLALRLPAERCDGEPQTPIAAEERPSKRRWEAEMQQWREQLRQWWEVEMQQWREGVGGDPRDVSVTHATEGSAEQQLRE
jgi:hypothetical protein